jgi:septum formation protein
MLRGLGLDLLVRPVDIDESPLPGETAEPYVLRLAREKAREVSNPGELILAADTTVVLDGKILGKPTDEAEARRMLGSLAGRSHQVLTGVAVLEADSGDGADGVVSTEVTIRSMSESEIAWYVGTGEPMDKAGSYAIQGLGALLVDSIAGNYPNVVGLPLPEVDRLFGRLGYRLLDLLP